jgi:DNA-binding NarL/FixJ family response regulator
VARMGRPNLKAEDYIQVLQLKAEGLTNTEIAQKLFLSVDAVKMRLERARKDLGARNTVHAVAIACQLGRVVVRLDK